MIKESDENISSTEITKSDSSGRSKNQIVNLILIVLLFFSFAGAGAGYLSYAFNDEWGFLVQAIVLTFLFCIILSFSTYRVIRSRKTPKQEQVIDDDISKLSDEELLELFKRKTNTSILFIVVAVLTFIYIIPAVFAGYHSYIGFKQRELLKAEITARNIYP